MADILARGEQVLFMSTRTAPDMSSNSDAVVKVMLPEMTAECLADPENQRGDQGIGSVACNFIQVRTTNSTRPVQKDSKEGA